MPKTEITLDNIRQVLREEIREGVHGEIHREVPPLIEQALIKERGYTKLMIQDMLTKAFIRERPYTQQMINDALLSFWEHNLEPAFEELHREIKNHTHEPA